MDDWQDLCLLSILHYFNKNFSEKKCKKFHVNCMLLSERIGVRVSWQSCDACHVIFRIKRFCHLQFRFSSAASSRRSNNHAVFLDFGYFFFHQPFSGCFEVRSTLLMQSLLAEKPYFRFFYSWPRVPVPRTQRNFFSPSESTDRCFPLISRSIIHSVFPSLVLFVKRQISTWTFEVVLNNYAFFHALSS